MSVAGYPATPLRVPQYTPFCDRNLKWVRIVADSIYRFCLALFYKISSYFLWTSHTYGFLAKHQLAKGGNQLLTYLTFKGEVIDFCMNFSERAIPKEKIPTSEEDWNHLIQLWAHQATEEIPLQKELLLKKEWFKEGFCLGSSLDFISSYLKAKKGSPLDAVKQISHRYVEGPPIEAILAQMFCHALDTSKLHEAAKNFDKQKLSSYRAEIEQWRAAECTRLEKQQNVSQEILDKLEARVEEKWQNRRKEAIRDRLTQNLAIETKRNRIVADSFGLKLEEPIAYACEKPGGQENQACFEKFMQDLPEGAFALSLNSSEKASGHMIAFIKTDKEHFIHDPNSGIFSIAPTNSTKRLWEITNRYLQHGICALKFFPVTPATPSN